ncbi:MAG: hypothetical protein EOP04_33925 [Proteobacteria bacterium]|nr:MAG: hypothetical protein EOP04_33925 [Pseudomonadota bacterium]
MVVNSKNRIREILDAELFSLKENYSIRLRADNLIRLPCSKFYGESFCSDLGYFIRSDSLHICTNEVETFRFSLNTALLVMRDNIEFFGTAEFLKFIIGILESPEADSEVEVRELSLGIAFSMHMEEVEDPAIWNLEERVFNSMASTGMVPLRFLPIWDIRRKNLEKKMASWQYHKRIRSEALSRDDRLTREDIIAREKGTKPSRGMGF